MTKHALRYFFEKSSCVSCANAFWRNKGVCVVYVQNFLLKRCDLCVNMFRRKQVVLEKERHV